MDEQRDGIHSKTLKRIDSLIKSARSGFVISLVGVFIPFLALIGLVVGFGYMFEVKGLLVRQPGIDSQRQEQLRIAAGRFKIMGILGLIILTLWGLIVGGIILSMR